MPMLTSATQSSSREEQSEGPKLLAPSLYMSWAWSCAKWRSGPTQPMSGELRSEWHLDLRTEKPVQDRLSVLTNSFSESCGKSTTQPRKPVFLIGTPVSWGFWEADEYQGGEWIYVRRNMASSSCIPRALIDFDSHLPSFIHLFSKTLSIEEGAGSTPHTSMSGSELADAHICSGPLASCVPIQGLPQGLPWMSFPQKLSSGNVGSLMPLALGIFFLLSSSLMILCLLECS